MSDYSSYEQFKSRASRAMKRRKLTEEHRFTICVALRLQYDTAIRFLDMHEPYASHFLVSAGKAWDAYKAFSGYPMNGYYHHEH